MGKKKEYFWGKSIRKTELAKILGTPAESRKERRNLLQKKLAL